MLKWLYKWFLDDIDGGVQGYPRIQVTVGKDTGG